MNEGGEEKMPCHICGGSGHHKCRICGRLYCGSHGRDGTCNICREKLK